VVAAGVGVEIGVFVFGGLGWEGLFWEKVVVVGGGGGGGGGAVGLGCGIAVGVAIIVIVVIVVNGAPFGSR